MTLIKRDEVFDFNADNGDIVYIHAGQMIDDDMIISDTSETDITSQDHTNEISDDTSMLIDSMNTSMEKIDILLDMYPNELLHALSDKI